MKIYEALMILSGIVQFVYGRSGMVILHFPRLVFGHFQDALALNQKTLNHNGGIIEALSYKIQVYPPTENSTIINGEFQDRSRSFCILSFHDKKSAKHWLDTDPLIKYIDTWSYSTDVNIIFMETDISRAMPFSWYNDVHVIGIINSRNDTIFREVIKPKINRIFFKYGGNKMSDSTVTWLRFSGTSWPPEDSDWIFYCPMPSRNNFTKITTSPDVIQLVSDYGRIVPSIQLYAAESFFSTSGVSGRCGIHLTTVLSIWSITICTYLWIQDTDNVIKM